MRKFLHHSMILGLVLAVLSGCGGGGGGTTGPIDPPIPETRYLYVSNFGLDKLFAFAINKTDGSLTEIDQEATQPEPRCIVVHPDRNHLFVCTNESNTDNDYIQIFSINDSDGTLSLENSIKLQHPQPLNPSEMTITPDGNYLIIAHQYALKVSIYSINLTANSITLVDTINTLTEPRSVAVHPNGKYFYIITTGENDIEDNGEITLFKLAVDGKATSISSLPAGLQPTNIVLNRTGSQLYLTNFTSGNLMVFSVNSGSGALTLGNTYTGEEGNARAIAVSPRGDMVFTGKNFGINSFTASGSNLSLVNGSPFHTDEASYSSMAVDSSGQFLYVGHGYSPEFAKITAYSINTTGELTWIDDYLSGESIVLR